jgi:hypothetical protein
LGVVKRCHGLFAGHAGEVLQELLEIFAKHGLVDIAVPAIRELRGELPDA